LNAVFNEFRSDFIGKASPVPFVFWVHSTWQLPNSGNPAPLQTKEVTAQYAFGRNAGSLFQRGIAVRFWLAQRFLQPRWFMPYAYPSDASLRETKSIAEEAFYAEMGGVFLEI